MSMPKIVINCLMLYFEDFHLYKWTNLSNKSFPNFIKFRGGNKSDECWKLLLQNLFSSLHLHICRKKYPFQIVQASHFIVSAQPCIRRSKKNQWVTNPVAANEEEISPDMDHHLILKKKLSMPYFYKHCCYPLKFSN